MDGPRDAFNQGKAGGEMRSGPTPPWKRSCLCRSRRKTVHSLNGRRLLFGGLGEVETAGNHRLPVSGLRVCQQAGHAPGRPSQPWYGLCGHAFGQPTRRVIFAYSGVEDIPVGQPRPLDKPRRHDRPLLDDAVFREALVHGARQRRPKFLSFVLRGQGQSHNQSLAVLVPGHRKNAALRSSMGRELDVAGHKLAVRVGGNIQ